MDESLNHGNTMATKKALRILGPQGLESVIVQD